MIGWDMKSVMNEINSQVGKNIEFRIDAVTKPTELMKKMDAVVTEVSRAIMEEETKITMKLMTTTALTKLQSQIEEELKARK